MNMSCFLWFWVSGESITLVLRDTNIMLKFSSLLWKSRSGFQIRNRFRDVRARAKNNNKETIQFGFKPLFWFIRRRWWQQRLIEILNFVDNAVLKQQWLFGANVRNICLIWSTTFCAQFNQTPTKLFHC